MEHVKSPEVSEYNHGLIVVGKNSYIMGGINYFAFDRNETLTIGNYCAIAGGVEFLVGAEHRTDLISTYPFNMKHHCSKGPIVIGNDVWIGQQATILSGVTIGDGAVIGARAVVAKDVKPYAVVAGNPARVKKFRFKPKQIERLLEIKWWDWPADRIKLNISRLSSTNIEEFINCPDCISSPQLPDQKTSLLSRKA